MAIKRPLDSFYVYQFLKKLSTPFDETEAYELGIIDDEGKVLKKQKELKTREEKDAFNRFDILINNLKKLLSKVPFGRTMLGRYTAALFLLKENNNTTVQTLEEDFWAFVEQQDLQELNEKVRYEDAPTMSTGAAVAGTGDDPVHWRHKKYQPGMKGNRKKYRNPLDGVTLLKRKKLKDLEEKVSLGDLKKVEQYADRLFRAVGIDVEFTRHFIDRVNDTRNFKNITPAELVRLFKQTYRKHGKKIPKLGPDAEAVIQDMQTDVNMPFVLKWDADKSEIDLVAKTIMRKKDFKTTNKKFTVEEPRVPRKKGQHRGSSSHSDLYTDENPEGTIKGLKFATVEDAEKSVKKIENSDRTHAHKVQAAVAMEQRARVMGKTAEANVYRKYINKMKKITKERQDD